MLPDNERNDVRLLILDDDPGIAQTVSTTALFVS